MLLWTTLCCDFYLEPQQLQPQPVKSQLLPQPGPQLGPLSQPRPPPQGTTSRGLSSAGSGGGIHTFEESVLPSHHVQPFFHLGNKRIIAGNSSLVCTVLEMEARLLVGIIYWGENKTKYVTVWGVETDRFWIIILARVGVVKRFSEFWILIVITVSSTFSLYPNPAATVLKNQRLKFASQLCFSFLHRVAPASQDLWPKYHSPPFVPHKPAPPQEP